jgi:uncharacterized UBP type Zn finger protein
VTCIHLVSTPLDAVPLPETIAGCPQCLAGGFRDWVHLRQCLTCGAIGCCDSSPRRHASKHYADTGHPVMRSIEPGEFWRWCYVDDAIG